MTEQNNTPAKIETIEDIVKYLKFAPFLLGFTQVKINSGIRARITGNGTNKTDKVKGLTEKDKQAIKEGMIEFMRQATEILDKV